MRILVVYYSRTGNTRDVAEHIAAKIGADVAQVHSVRYRLGIASYLLAAFDSWRRASPAIEVQGPAPDHYDQVIVLSPVWTGRPSAPIRAYLHRNAGKMKKAAFVLTCIGWCPPQALAEMADLAGIEPAATFVLRQSDIAAAAGLPATLVPYLTTLKRRDEAA
jgi:flavodoxin